MATAELEVNHSMRARMSAESVDMSSGTIRGCVVAKSGVQAAGKFVFIDVNGQITRDEKLARKKLPVFTDDETLLTLIAAARNEGGSVKAREDHDDSIGARAGYADAFKLDGKNVKADMHLFDAYRNRAVVLETAKKTPDEIGLSIDFTPVFEILEDRALMRIGELHAVDIVDEGAVTPDGLLLSVGVDSTRQSQLVQSRTTEQMATSPSIDQLMEQVQTMAKALSECQAAITKMATPPAAPAESDAMKAIKEMSEQLKALTGGNDIREQLKKVTETVTQLKRERVMLGFRGTDADRVRLAGAPVEDIEKFSNEQKSYLQLVRDVREKDSKLSAADAHDRVQKTPEGKAAYALHLSAKGITGRQTMAA